jgi:transposase
MVDLFWLTDAQVAVLEADIPTNHPGVIAGGNRAAISGIIHVLHLGCRWCDVQPRYSPSTTIYNRFNRWSKAGLWQTLLDTLVAFDQARPNA